jgi:hypothetical protein
LRRGSHGRLGDGRLRGEAGGEGHGNREKSG